MRDRDAIDALVTRLYAAFRNKGCVPAVDSLYDIFISEARVIKAVDTVPVVMSVSEFVESRRRMLGDGSLIDFDEWEIDARTEICGHVASRWSLYRKVGVKDGVPFDARGLKSLQYVNTADGWKISALVWDDERHGLVLGECLMPVTTSDV